MPEVGIYKRKQESKMKKQENKKIRKQEHDQESGQEKKFFFLDRFLGRVLVFLFSYFLVIFYKFPPLS